MDRTYPPLALHSLRPGTRFTTPDEHRERVTLESPASRVMTDLRHVPAATIDSEAPMDAAHRFMIRRGVRLLLVTDDERRVQGLITATDILGEKPVTLRMTAGLARQDLKVRDVMTPVGSLEALAFADVARAAVGHIVETLKKSGRQHALVCEPDRGTAGDGADAVRGIFSLSQIARQLGVPIASSEVARSFAEIEAALSH